jgi:histone H3/H4
VQKILTEILPPSSGLATTKDFRDSLIEACVEFVTLISSEANEISEKDAKKTISAEHVAMALKDLGFDSYVGPVMEASEEFKKTMAVSHGLLLG